MAGPELRARIAAVLTRARERTAVLTDCVDEARPGRRSTRR